MYLGTVSWRARYLVVLAPAWLALACGRIGYDAGGLSGEDGGAPVDALVPGLDARFPGDASSTGDASTPADDAGVVVAPGTTLVSAGEDHSCALRDGRVFCWGLNSDGQLGIGSVSSVSSPTEVTTLPAPALWMGAANEHTCALVAGGAVYCWGRADLGQLGNAAGGSSTSAPTTPVMDLTSPLEVDVGHRHTCARASTGIVWCWGHNGYGQLGDGTMANSRSVPVSTGLAAIDVDTGGQHTCAIVADRTLRCWGFDAYGQLGSGTGDVNSPAMVLDITGVIAVSAGRRHTCAITESAGTFCWGAGDVGQLANGEPPASTFRPEAVVGLTEALVEIAAGGFHTCGRAASGAIYCWGENTSGQLGDGTTTERHAPVRVTGLPAASSVVVGDSHSCALTTDQRVFCWGNGADGRLGDGSTIARTTPIEVPLP